MTNASIFDRLESEVRSYCRSFPTVFTRARGALQWDAQGRRYVDLFAGAGALNYGHNDPLLKRALIAYLEEDGVTHSLDMHTAAKARFLDRLEQRVLAPRGLDYKVMFPGPTGTNAVEAALKLARKVTGRTQVISFTNGFHGMTLGALAVTGNAGKRAGAGVPLEHASSLPFDGYVEGMDTIALFEQLLDDGSSGIDVPAAVIVEAVQAEGGVNVASAEWLRRLERACRSRGVLLVLDEIQVGCGRTGPFFGFESAGITPDIVTLSKSLSGYGVPLSVVLLRPELDVFTPGEHNGTFRGHNLAFVTAAAALDAYWSDDALSREVERKGAHVRERLSAIAERHPELELSVRGTGMIQGLASSDARLPSRISKLCFERGVLVETAGPRDEVLKLLPPLMIEDALLDEGLDAIASAVSQLTSRETRASAAPAVLTNGAAVIGEVHQ
ncbi:MAG: diaminobutyrate--2-oxoglutarate transaminase [Myxococcota bacterium]|nr:diaminobutyrate--2-oxoglutarate transaminase [Myxococcota bacterium]